MRSAAATDARRADESKPESYLRAYVGAMRRLRATRANPPGLAFADDRRATYSATLQQHDDLLG